APWNSARLPVSDRLSPKTKTLLKGLAAAADTSNELQTAAIAAAETSVRLMDPLLPRFSGGLPRAQSQSRAGGRPVSLHDHQHEGTDFSLARGCRVSSPRVPCVEDPAHHGVAGRVFVSSRPCRAREASDADQAPRGHFPGEPLVRRVFLDLSRGAQSSGTAVLPASPGHAIGQRADADLHREESELVEAVPHRSHPSLYLRSGPR